MTIRTGLSKKIGLRDFGSLGATCEVTFEVSHSLLEDRLDTFHSKVQNAFTACRQCVQDELARQQVQAGGSNASGNHANVDVPAAPAATSSNGNAHANGNAHHNGATGHAASEKQMDFARQLAKAIPGLGIRRLETLTQKMYGKSLVALTSMDASGLIDTLKSVKDGEIDIDRVLSSSES
jgi:hypothetical protein